MDLYGNDGRIYTITNKIANRDTGDFYDVDGHSDLIAKIIHDDKRGSRGRWAKVDEWTKMTSLGSVFLDQVVIPKVALYDSHDMNYKTFHGYLMDRLLEYVPLNHIINDGIFNYHKKVWIAKNLCILTREIHKHKYIIGDFNSNKILLNPKTGLVVISELDDIQFSVNRYGKVRLSPCTVGVPQFLAPEIHKRLIYEKANLETVSQTPSDPLFTEYTDWYSLAYHIFSLLMGVVHFLLE